MKKTDIKRLEKAAEHYDKVVQLLVQAEESIWRGDTERFPDGVSTYYIVSEFRKNAADERSMLRFKINAFKELFVND